METMKFRDELIQSHELFKTALSLMKKKKEYLDDWCFCISFNEKISCFQEFLDEGCSTVIQYQKSNFEITFRKYFSSR